VCFYRIETKCGQLKIDINSMPGGDQSGGVLIEYLEFEDGKIALADSAVEV